MTEIYMPRLSDTMEEGVISDWRKQIGEKVSPGDILVEIETDKAVMEYEAYDEGYLVKQSVSAGDTVPIGAVIGLLGDSPDAVPESDGPATPPAREETEVAAGESNDEQKAAAQSSSEGGTRESVRDEVPASGASATQAGPASQRTRTSPLARRLAREYGLDIDQIQGSGPKGRVVRADIEAAAKQQASAPTASASAAEPPTAAPAPSAVPEFDDGRDSEEVKPNNIRRVVARRMAEAKQEVPHFYLRRTIDAGPLKAFRADINAQLADTGVKVSVNDLIVKAVAVALSLNPQVNASWVDGRLLRHGRINIGVAVAVEGGLVVPVLRDVDRTPLSQIATKTRELAGKAHDSKLTPQDMSGGTFSVSNLGMFGIESFSAVINPPEAGILAVGAMRQEPVVRDGEIVPADVIALEISIDHRSVDGATAAVFFKDLVEVLENPMRVVL